jgi:uncharacterized paraquat-inducible protein A
VKPRGLGVENGVTAAFCEWTNASSCTPWPPHEVVTSKDTMPRRAWRCCNCCEVSKSEQPNPRPAPCVRCGSIWFQTSSA